MAVEFETVRWLSNLSDVYIGLFTYEVLESLAINRFDPSLFYRTLDGRQMQDSESLMNKFQQNMPFFDGFGRNYQALYDCLCLDIQWEEDYSAFPPVVTPERIILVIENAEYLLKNDVPDWLIFLQTFIQAGEYWRTEIFDPDFDFTNIVDVNRLIDMHKPTPFRLLLCCTAKNKLLKVKSNIDAAFTQNVLNKEYCPIRYIYSNIVDTYNTEEVLPILN